MKHVMIIFVLLCTAPVFAQTEPVQSKWDVYLDHAYELTYWDEEELTSWITDQEKEFGQTLAQYSDTWQKNLFGSDENNMAVPAGNGRFAYPEHNYKRLAVAELLLYLMTGDLFRLDEAIRVIEELKGKIEKSDIAFWYNFIQAYDALADRGEAFEKKPDKFVKSIYKIWLNIVLPHEDENSILKVPSTPVSMKSFSYSMPYLYENMANMILRKAIIQCELRNTGALGAVILALHDRLSLPNGYASTVKTIVNRMSGPKSDSNNLFYTVIFLEAEQYRFASQNALNESGMSSKAEEAYGKSSHYYNLSYDSANTNQGRAAVLSDYLDLVSFAYSRLPGKEEIRSDSVFARLSGHEGELTVEKAMSLFDDLSGSEVRVDDWGQHGFAKRNDYVSAMHSLWSSIVEISLWSAYYHEKGITETDIQEYSDVVIKTEAALLLYLNFFERYLSNGYIDIIPDNAYFNAAEAAAKYSSLNSRLAPYSTDMDNYYKAFSRLLQYVEIFPFNPEAVMELAHQINEMGKPGLYVKYVLPIAVRLKELGLAQSLKDGDIPETFISSLENLQNAIPDIMMNANTFIYLQGSGAKTVREDIKTKLDKIKNKSSEYITSDYSGLGSENNDEVKSVLDDIIEQVSSGPEMKEETDRERFIADVKKLRKDIIALEEAEEIMAGMDMHKETSKNIRKELAQKIDHPLHTMLRQFFYDMSVNNNKYYQTFSMVKEEAESNN
jgi:hypothetical protein